MSLSGFSEKQSFFGRILFFSLFFLAINVVFLFLPLVNVISGAYVTLSTFLVVCFWIIADKIREDSSFYRLRGILFSCFYGLIPALFLMVLVSSFRSGQDIAIQIFFFFANLFPGLVLLLSLRYLIEKIIKSDILIFFIITVIVGLSVLLTLEQIASGPGQVFYNIFFGRIHIVGAAHESIGYLSGYSVFILNRLWVLFLGISLVIIGDGKNIAKGVAFFVIAVTVAFFMPLTFGLSSEGVFLDKIVKARVNTEHFRIHYIPGIFSRQEIELLKDQFEWEYYYVSSILSVKAENPLNVYLVNNNSFLPGGKGDNLSALGSGIFSDEKIYLICFRDKEIPHILSLRHEIVHALTLNWYSINSYSFPMIEGLAVAIDRNYNLGPQYHFESAALEHYDSLPSVDTFYNNTGFLEMPATNAYDLAGSFTGFLMYKYGAGSFSQVAAGYDWQEVYGKGLVKLEEEWRNFISSCQVSDGTACLLYDKFRFAQGNKELDEDENDISLQRKRYRELMKDRRYSEILYFLDDKDTVLATRWKASALRMLGRQDDAIAMIDSALERKDIDVSLLLPLKRNCAIDLEKWEKAMETLSDNSMMFSLLKDEKGRVVFRKALLSDKEDMCRILYENRNIHPVLSYLSANCSVMASKGKIPDWNRPNYTILFSPWIFDETGVLPYQLLYDSYADFLEEDSSYNSEKGRIYLNLGKTAYYSSFYDEAEKCFTLASVELSPSSIIQAEVGEWLRRVKWKRTN